MKLRNCEQKKCWVYEWKNSRKTKNEKLARKSNCIEEVKEVCCEKVVSLQRGRFTNEICK